jgi:signal transduction histidine kinase
VEAITDGRSLHRRLPANLGTDELSRLGTTLNAMIARLETSFGALRRFTADASHELKTPLTVLRADVERAMHPGAQGSEAMQALEEALQETARMSDLVDSLLTLARADEGRFDLHREPINLGPLVRDVYETAVILGEDCGLTVLMTVLEEGVIEGDAQRLRQLFLNLVTNAIKYTPRGRSRGVVAQPSAGRRDRLRGPGFGDRDVRRRSLARLRAVLACRPCSLSYQRAWRLRAGSGNQSMDRAGARRTHHGAIPARPRLRVHGGAAHARHSAHCGAGDRSGGKRGCGGPRCA